MKFAIALAALATTTLATPALAGPYVETKSEFKGTDEDFGSQVHQARVGYDWRMGIATPYYYKKDSKVMITADISVKKRNGRGTETLDLNKIHIMVEEACKGLSGVSASQVEIQSQLSLYDGISTADIQETLIRSASDLIDLEH